MSIREQDIILTHMREGARITPLHKAWNLKFWPSPWKEHQKNSTWENLKEAYHLPIANNTKREREQLWENWNLDIYLLT